MSGESKIIGPKVGYVELLDHHTNLNNEKRKDDNLYAPLRPSASGECARNLAFAQNEFAGNAKYPKEIKSPDTHRLLSLGHSVEWHLLNQMVDAWKDTKYKVKYKQQVLRFFQLPDGTYIEGAIDGVIASEKHKCLFDCKSKKDKFSSFFKTDWDETTSKLQHNPHVHEFGVNAYWIDDLDAFLDSLNDPFFAANFLQLNFYYHDENHFIRNSGITHCAIIQYNKNDSRIREIRFKPSEMVYEKVKTKFLLVASTIQETKDPMKVPRDYALGSIKCAFCPFAKECWGKDVDSLKEYFKTFPKKKWATDLDRLNPDVQASLITLFDKYHENEKIITNSLTIEQEIVKILLAQDVMKIKVNKDYIYELKHLKTGGPKNGPQIVLRRSKV